MSRIGLRLHDALDDLVDELGRGEHAAERAVADRERLDLVGRVVGDAALADEVGVVLDRLRLLAGGGTLGASEAFCIWASRSSRRSWTRSTACLVSAVLSPAALDSSAICSIRGFSSVSQVDLRSSASSLSSS
jgi:hypothetical protein